MSGVDGKNLERNSRGLLVSWGRRGFECVMERGEVLLVLFSLLLDVADFARDVL